MTFSDPVSEAHLASSFRLERLRLRLLAQPQVQREWRKLARLRGGDPGHYWLARLRGAAPEDYWPACERLAYKLRGFFTIDEIDLKAKRLADSGYSDEWVWGTVTPRRDLVEPPAGRHRRPRATGMNFRHYLDTSRDIWVDERIESAARHIARGLDTRAAADGSEKPGPTERKQISRLRALLLG